MQKSKIIKFRKLVQFVPNQTYARIDIISGVDRKGKAFQHINQINTANSVIFDKSIEFESFLFSVQEMTELLISQGYETFN